MESKSQPAMTFSAKSEGILRVFLRVPDFIDYQISNAQSNFIPNYKREFLSLYENVLNCDQKKAVKKIRLSMYLKQGRFDKLVYIRYFELVERLKRKHIVTADNPLPMELCEIIARYTADKEVTDANTLSDNADIENHDENINKSGEKIYKKVYEAYSQVFEYMEKVLYAGYKTTPAEYNDFYSKLRILK